MSYRHYITTLIALVISIIVNLPYVFKDVLFFKKLIKNDGDILFLVGLSSVAVYSVLVSRYFFKRKWRLSFYSGVLFFIVYTLLYILDKTSYYQEISFMTLGILSIVYLATQIFHGASFFTTAHLRSLQFIKWHGILLILSAVSLMILSVTLNDYVNPVLNILWFIDSVLLILHFVFERNSEGLKLVSEEILDD